MNPGWELDRANISSALRQHRGTKQRGDWLDHHCIFHQDAHRSASWNESTGVYYCRTEDRTYLPPVVMQRLFVSQIDSSPGRKQAQRRRPDRQAPEKVPDHIWTYVFPDGNPSHMKWRWDEPKRFIQVPIGGSPGDPLPSERWALYGDFRLQEGAHIVVVEGEKVVDRVAQLADSLEQVPIIAITAGSAADTSNRKVEIAARLGQLKPKSITLWPDNDEPGSTAMRALHQELSRQNLTHATVPVAELGLPIKGDLVDYADAGNSLATLIARQTGSLEQEPILELVRKTLVTPGQMALPDIRQLHSISDDNGQMFWWATYHQLPSARQLKEYLAAIRQKSSTSPLTPGPRSYTNERVTWWRPANQGQVYRIEASGIDPYSDDPPGVFLYAPDDGRHVDTSVDLHGSKTDLDTLLSIWELTDLERAMIEGWLVCAMGGLQTPILFMRSPAATGKSTLARFLLQIVEPMCPELDSKVTQDARQFAMQLLNHPVAMIDNVSRMESDVEDMLSRLVTGYTVSVRPLYSDRLVTTFLRRAMILTTTNYDIYKGDLASRTVVLQPSRKTQGYFSDRYVQATFTPIIPKVRGYVMKLLQSYFAKRESIQEDTIAFRIGDLGVVFATLGYNTSELAALESTQRSEVVSSNDAWLEAMVELWKDEASISFVKTTQEVLKWLREFGCENIPAEKSPKLARWFAQKSPFFLDYGFEVERVMNNPRGYRFRRIEAN
jgi:hypothetical protein